MKTIHEEEGVPTIGQATAAATDQVVIQNNVKNGTNGVHVRQHPKIFPGQPSSATKKTYRKSAPPAPVDSR
jgi:hypothetical protein